MDDIIIRIPKKYLEIALYSVLIAVLVMGVIPKGIKRVEAYYEDKAISQKGISAEANYPECKDKLVKRINEFVIKSSEQKFFSPIQFRAFNEELIKDTGYGIRINFYEGDNDKIGFADSSNEELFMLNPENTAHIMIFYWIDDFGCWEIDDYTSTIKDLK